MTAAYDVVVVGGGGSGLAAALSAAEGGCRVLVLEKHNLLHLREALDSYMFAGKV